MSVTYKKPIDQQLVDKLVDFLARGNKKTIIDLSGSVNSLVACSLLKTALGGSFTAVIVDLAPSPHPGSDSEETKNLFRFASFSGISCIIVKAGIAYNEQIAIDPPKGQHKEAFNQRFMSNILLQTADNLGAVICDPLDKSERVLGLKKGNEGSIVPFYSLYKSEIYDLYSYLNLPQEFVKEEISTFGVSYAELDPMIYLLLEKQLSVGDIASEHVDAALLAKLKKTLDHQVFTTPNQLIL